MSKTYREVEDMSNVRADFDSFISVGDELNARAAIDIMGESYSELEAMRMHREANRVFNPEPKAEWECEEERGLERDADMIYDGAHKDVW